MHPLSGIHRRAPTRVDTLRADSDPRLMKTTRTALTIALFALASPAIAQQMYRCGNTYSQTPCAAGSASKSLYSGAAPERAAGATGYELCAAQAVKQAGSPEPESARTAPAGQRKSEVIQYAGQSISTHRFDLTVDAKTQFGVYSGPVAYSCWLSEDEARVLQLRRGTGR